jgi:LEA14-like dessication related protein
MVQGRMRRRAVLLVLGFLAGCATGPRSIEAPRVEVTGLTALGPSGAGQRFSVRLLVDNPNVEPLVIEELNFAVRLASEGRLDGRFAERLTIPALDRDTLTVEVESDIVSSLSRLIAIVQGPANTLPYEIVGNVRLDRRFQAPLPFFSRGEVPLAMSSVSN